MVALSTPVVVANQNIEGGMSALPVGLGQTVIAISSELKGAKGNTNSGMLAVTLNIIDGPNKGRSGGVNFNIYNENADARRIAEESLAKMGWCVGVPVITNSELLHNKPFKIDVAPQIVKAGQEDKGYTEITAWYDMAGNKPKNGTMANAGGNAQGNNGGNGGNNGGDWNGQQSGNGQQGQNPQSNQQQQNNVQNGNGQQDQSGNGNGQQNWNGNQHQNNGQNQQQDQQQNWNGNGQQGQNQQQNQNPQQNWNGNGQQDQGQQNNGQNQQQGNNGGGGAAPWNRPQQ